MRKNIKAFTLIEVIVVLAILAILATIGVSVFFGLEDTSGEKVCLSQSINAKRLLEIYTSSGVEYEVDGVNGTDFLVEAGLLSEPYVCPDGGEYSWTVEDERVSLVCSVHGGAKQAGAGSNMEILSQLGDWQIEDGVLTDIGHGERRVIFDDTFGDDYTITADATLVSGNGGYAMYYHATEEAGNISGYAFQFDLGYSNSFIVRKVIDGKETSAFQVASMAQTMGDDFDIYAPHNIKIDVEDDHHSIYVDNVKVMEFIDDTFTEGSVGCRTWSTAEISVENLSVQNN